MTHESAPGEALATSPSGTEFLVVMRARSSARFLPEEGWELNLEAVPGLGLGPVRVRTFTRWAEDGGHQVPRELIVEVRGRTGSLDDAVAKFSVIARPIATMAGFVANVRVGPLEVHLAYECTPHSAERGFLEAFLPDETGSVAEGRIIRQDLLVAACTALMALKADSARVSRALRQYELALREWHVGGEWLALSHLYMAVEALTKAAIRKACANRGITDKQLAQSLGVVTDDPEPSRWRQILAQWLGAVSKSPGRSRWHQILEQRVRQQMIFAGDHETYKTAKEASDGIEHGYLGMDEVAEHALKCTAKTFDHVRRAILELLDLPISVASDLMTIKPKDVQSRRTIIRGRLVGTAEDPAAEGQLYPLLEWRSGIGSVIREGSTFTFHKSDKVTVRTHPDLSFRLDRVEVYGRLEDGQAPVDMSEPDTLLQPTPEPESASLIAEVMPLIDAAAASRGGFGQSIPHVLAFNLFGQGVAHFQSAQILIRDGRPVEALTALRGLTIIAARFEQITTENLGIGAAVRLALDAPDELGAEHDAMAEYRGNLLSAAAAAGVTVPDDLSAPETSTIFRSLELEMRLATSAANGTYAAAALHVKRPGAEYFDFHTQLEPGPFTEMIASACVLAQITLLGHAASIFGWTVDQPKVDDLLQKARTLNESAAQTFSAATVEDGAAE